MKTLTLSVALLIGGFIGGCSSPCDALADLCSKCKDANTKQACEATVSTYRNVPITGNSGCQAVLDANTYSTCK
jgi:hypothetical protein